MSHLTISESQFIQDCSIGITYSSGEESRLYSTCSRKG